MSDAAQIAAPRFPPLFHGRAVAPAECPFAAAIAAARQGCDAGLVCHAVTADALRAAIVFAPETPLADAVVALAVCAVGYQNALGALAPPELAVHLEWGGGIRVNGAACGALRIAGPAATPDAVPDWLVVGVEVPVMAFTDAPGATPDRTTLYDEGCGDLDPTALLEAWVRHSLVWLNRWLDGDLRGLHAEWRGLVHGIGAPAVTGGAQGTFTGVDERFGMLLKDGDATRLVPLTAILEVPT